MTKNDSNDDDCNDVMESSDNDTSALVNNYLPTSINTVDENTTEETLFEQSLMEESEFAPSIVCAEEDISLKLAAHVRQFREMRQYVKELVLISRAHWRQHVTWVNRTLVDIADFAQNLDMPHFGSEQPGDTYYYSPLGIYLFGIVSTHTEKDSLLCQYFKEGEG